MCCLSCRKLFFSQLIKADFIHLSYIHVLITKRKTGSVSQNLCNNRRSILFFSPSIIHGSSPCLLYKGELSIYHTILAEWWQISGYTVLSFQPFFPLAAKMPENAEAVSATISTNRNCTIEITNVSANYCLINPK